MLQDKWTAPNRKYVTKQDERTQNVVTNQFDYIIAKIEYGRFVSNVRSYAEIQTEAH